MLSRLRKFGRTTRAGQARWVALWLLVLLIGGASSIYFWLSREDHASDSSEIRHLLLISLDTVRADHLGCYGDSHAKTPHLDRLAAGGVLFERCFSTAPTTLPAHASLLTGLYPFRHGARNNGTHRLSDSVRTLAEHFQAAGFLTHAIVSSLVLARTYGLSRGFADYDEAYRAEYAFGHEAGTVVGEEARAQQAIDRALAWLDETPREQPFFLWLHLFDAHRSYAPPEPFAGDFEARPYAGEIAYLDAQLGRLFARLERVGLREQTLIVVVSDHGESLGEHGESAHGHFVYDATTRVPMIWSHASLAGGRRLEGVVSLVDVLPTLSDLFSFPSRAATDGISLAKRLQDASAENSDPERAVYMESMLPFYMGGWSSLHALRTRDWRYIEAPRSELYREGEESQEANLLEREEDRGAQFRRRLQAVENEDQEQRLEADEVAWESLARLGYVSFQSPTDAQEASAARERIDPKDRIQIVEAAQAALEHIRHDRPQAALPILEALLEKDPHASHAAHWYPRVLLQLQKPAQARDWLRSRSSLPGLRARDWILLASIEIDFEAFEQARKDLQQALVHDERDPQAYFLLGLVAQRTGAAGKAESWYQRALAVDADHAPSLIDLALIHAGRGSFAMAGELLQRALLVPGHPLSAEYNYAVFLMRETQFDAAAELLTACLEATVPGVEPKAVVAAWCVASLRAGRESRLLSLAPGFLERYPDDIPIRISVALALARAGESSESGQHLRHALEVDRESMRRWASEDHELAQLLDRLGLDR